MPKPSEFQNGPQYICLAGPTACGKSACALAIAQSLRNAHEIEIISVDSALVYRGMDVGTAKPTAEERALIPHHLIDIIDPIESYSAARFVSDATRLISEIRARHRWPLLVGGTMLYFKALFEGLDAMPPADAGVRAALAQELQLQGLHSLYAQLEQVDPPTASRLAPGDTQRILRALEVYRVSGQTLSSLQKKSSSARQTEYPLLISLEPSDRTWLHQRIEQRFMQMLAQGLVAEVDALMKRGDLHPDLPSMRCVGYRQSWEGLQRGDTSLVAERGIAATRQLAKRQMTWLRSMPQRQVVACDLPDSVQHTIELARQGISALQR